MARRNRLTMQAARYDAPLGAGADQGLCLSVPASEPALGLGALRTRPSAFVSAGGPVLRAAAIRAISRMMVDGALVSPAAMARIVKPLTRKREIVSRWKKQCRRTASGRRRRAPDVRGEYFLRHRSASTACCRSTCCDDRSTSPWHLLARHAQRLARARPSAAATTPRARPSSGRFCTAP